MLGRPPIALRKRLLLAPVDVSCVTDEIKLSEIDSSLLALHLSYGSYLSLLD